MNKKGTVVGEGVIHGGADTDGSFLLAQGIFSNGESTHRAVAMSAVTPTPTKLLKAQGITYNKDYDYSGECKPNLESEDDKLTTGGIKKQLGYPLTKIVFNLKGTRTTQVYRGNSTRELVSFIPKQCFEVTYLLSSSLFSNSDYTKESLTD